MTLPLFILTILTLVSGKQMDVTVVYQDEQVVVVQDKQSGQRFQYPRHEVLRLSDEPEAAATTASNEKRKEDSGQSKIAFRLALSGGAASVTRDDWGGHVAAELQIGSRNLAGKNIFLGGSVGYSGVLRGGTLSYVPLQVVTSIPFIDGKHSPELGLAVGYGFSASKNKGGLCGGVDINWRYQYSEKGALLLGLYARYQQDKIASSETIDGNAYSTSTGVSIMDFGTRLTLQF